LTISTAGFPESHFTKDKYVPSLYISAEYVDDKMLIEIRQDTVRKSTVTPNSAKQLELTEKSFELQG